MKEQSSTFLKQVLIISVLQRYKQVPGGLCLGGEKATSEKPVLICQL